MQVGRGSRGRVSYQGMGLAGQLGHLCDGKRGVWGVGKGGPITRGLPVHASAITQGFGVIEKFVGAAAGGVHLGQLAPWLMLVMSRLPSASPNTTKHCVWQPASHPEHSEVSFGLAEPAVP